MINIQFAIDYLKQAFFTNVKYLHEIDGALFFVVTDEDDSKKKVQFESIQDDKVYVSVREKDGCYYVLDVLTDF